MSEWIDCSTRLPEQNIEVFVAFKEVYPHNNLQERVLYGTGICFNTANNNWELEWAEEFYDYKVIAWMPIPEYEGVFK